jgi:hypothetical protein
MSGGAADIGALLDPGPELSSYDPAWEARWDKANALLRLFRERDPSGSSELAAQLVEELCQACSAQFRFACDLEEHLARESAGPAQRVGLPLPQIAGSATPEEMTARHQAFRALCARVEAYRAAAPFEDWDTGVFRLEPRTGCAREIRDLEVSQDWGLDRGQDLGRRARVRLILERHGEDFHVCVIEHPLSHAPLTLAARDAVAQALAAEFLAERRAPRVAGAASAQDALEADGPCDRPAVPALWRRAPHPGGDPARSVRQDPGRRDRRRARPPALGGARDPRHGSRAQAGRAGLRAVKEGVGLTKPFLPGRDRYPSGWSQTNLLLLRRALA